MERNLLKEFEQDEILAKVLQQVSAYQVPIRISQEGAWENLLIKIKSGEVIGVTEEEKDYSSRFRMLFRIAAAAVVLLGLFTFIFFHYSVTRHYVVGKGGRHSIFLPDGSRVTLNSESTLSYSAYQWYKNRKLNLEGEGFFEVSSGEPFVVTCGKNTVTVLGTSFNVSSRSERFKVECLSGSVKIDVQQKHMNVINKGEALAYCGAVDSIELYEINSQNGATWLKGEFYYQREPLSFVIEELERQFNVEIQYPELSERVYTGYFNKTDLKQALELVCKPMGLDYDIKDNQTVVIK